METVFIVDIVITLALCFFSFCLGRFLYNVSGAKTIGTIFVDESEGETHIWLECTSMDAIKASDSEAIFRVVVLDDSRK